MLIKNNPNITRKELAASLGMTIDGVKYHIRKLTSEGTVSFVGSSRKGYWDVKD